MSKCSGLVLHIKNLLTISCVISGMSKNYNILKSMSKTFQKIFCEVVFQDLSFLFLPHYPRYKTISLSNKILDWEGVGNRQLLCFFKA
jgi:hypothetical protein